MTVLPKMAILRKRKNEKTSKFEWALVSKKDQSKVLKWFGPQKPSAERVEEEEKRVEFHKHKKAQVLETLDKIATDLENDALIHLSDAIMDCMEVISQEKSKESDVVTRLGEIATLLDKQGNIELAEHLDEILPDVLELKVIGEKKYLSQKRKRISASQAYKMANVFYRKYAIGEVDENSFEYLKMKELKAMLKMGFLLPPPANYEKLPVDSNNWWDHFSKNED